MIVKQITKNRFTVSSNDGQFYVIVDKEGFRQYRMAFMHDSDDRPLSVSYTYCEGMAKVKAKNFVWSHE